MPREITLQQAAEALGVHYMTAYRYVRLGRLAARKDGAVSHVRTTDLDRMRATVSPGPGRRPRGGDPGSHWAERLEARLLAGDGAGALGVADSSLASGLGMDDLYVGVIAPAMRSIGDRWGRGEIDVAHEHRATVLVADLLARVGARFVRPGRTRGTVVVGAAPGERHDLPVAIVAGLLRGNGYAVENLGADVPAGSFVVAAVSSDRLTAVGISVTMAEHLAAAAYAVALVRSALGPDVTILAGGRAVDGEAGARDLGADCWAPDARSVVELVGQLRRT